MKRLGKFLIEGEKKKQFIISIEFSTKHSIIFKKLKDLGFTTLKLSY